MADRRTLIIPRVNGAAEPIETTQSLLFVGANGSGKTRLGAWIEISSPQRPIVHRISAQKSLTMPNTTTPVAIDIAERSLLWGNPDSTDKAHYKWRQNPATSPLNDFEKLMVYLFSDETEVNAKFKAAYRASTERIEAPITKMDRLKEVWERILPHRELVIGGLRIQTKVKGQDGTLYNSSEMSDGERVIFYLIGQCLAAPVDGIIVIDEPELHLHKSIQADLWAEIEKLRPDCLFVYLTHDIDFALAQDGATRIWIKSFDGTSWDWEIIRPDDSLPDELLLKVLGSRRPVVFVEGDSSGYDLSLYRAILSDFLVLARGSCSQVITTVKALRANTELHHLQVYGIVDRDRRTASEIADLEAASIYVLSVAEVENLFCTKELLALVSHRLERDPEADYQAVSNAVFRRLNSELDVQVSIHVASEVQYQLGKYDNKARGVDALTEALNSLASGIDVASIYSTYMATFKQILENCDYEALLSVYNRKSLVTQTGEILGLRKGQLPDLVVRMARGDSQNEVRSVLRKYMGNFPVHIA